MRKPEAPAHSCGTLCAPALHPQAIAGHPHTPWNQDDQPSHEEAFEKLTTRVHPGAIVLLHNTSRTNGEILGELLTRWEEMGYRFESLSELTGKVDF